MSHDPTEKIRREMVAEINSAAAAYPTPESLRAALEESYGADGVWDTAQLTSRFEVLGFMAPFCVVKERATGRKGSVEFTHSPRFYFNFVVD